MKPNRFLTVVIALGSTISAWTLSNKNKIEQAYSDWSDRVTVNTNIGMLQKTGEFDKALRSPVDDQKDILSSDVGLDGGVAEGVRAVHRSNGIEVRVVDEEKVYDVTVDEKGKPVSRIASRPVNPAIYDTRPPLGPHT